MTKKPEEVKYTQQDFLVELEKLSKRMGYKLNIIPELFQQDNGTFSIKIRTEVIPSPQEN